MSFESFTDKLLSRTLIAISVFHDTQSLFSTIDPNPTSSLNVSCPDPTDMSYGVAVWNHLLVFQLNLSLMTLLILLLCLTVRISPWRFLQVQSPLSMIFTLLYLPFPQPSIVKPSLISLPFSLPPWMESHYCPLLYCLHPPPAQMSVKLWSFMKAWWTSPVLPLYLVTLSSCNLRNIIIRMGTSFLIQWRVYLFTLGGFIFDSESLHQA